MKVECAGCGDDCSHAYATWRGDPYHVMCWDFEMLGSIGKPQTQAREALAGLYGLLQMIYGHDDVRAEIKSAIATNHRMIEAARVLHVAPLDEPKF